MEFWHSGGYKLDLESVVVTEAFHYAFLLCSVSFSMQILKRNIKLHSRIKFADFWYITYSTLEL